MKIKMSMKSTMAVLYILFLLALAIAFTLHQKSKEVYHSPDRKLTIRVPADDEHLAVLHIDDRLRQSTFVMKTRASVYSKYSVQFLNDGHFEFISSDIGSGIFRYEDGSWQTKARFLVDPPDIDVEVLKKPERRL